MIFLLILFESITVFDLFYGIRGNKVGKNGLTENS